MKRPTKRDKIRRKSTRGSVNRRKQAKAGYESLEPRQMLAGDFGLYADLDVTADWAGEFVGGTGTTDRGYDVVVQQDQKIVVAGVVAKTIQQASQDLMVAKYNADGSVDTSFNNGAGFNSVDFGTNFRDIGSDLTIQNDGKIVVVGTGYDYGDGLAEHLIAARFNADGSLDASYTDQPFDFKWTSDVLAHSNGKTYIIGVAKDGGKNELLLTRLNADFTLDTSFGSGGVILHDYASSLDSATTGTVMIEQSDGKIIVAGIADKQGYYARLNEDGSFDTSYATGGEGIIDTHTSQTGGGGRNRFDHVVLDAVGNAYFSGISDVTADASDIEVVIVKIDNTGTLVSDFGSGGIFRYNPTSGAEDGVAELDQSGNLILSGNSSGLGEGFLAWVNSDGTLDQEYVAQRSGELRGLAVDASNRAVVTGESSNATLDTWLLRVNPNVVFADSFENGQWNGQWQETQGNYWATSSQRSTDGSSSAEFSPTSWWGSTYVTGVLATTDTIDMSPYGSAELAFDWYIESSFDSGEYVKLEFWNGSSWSEILSLDGNADQENTWHHEVIQLDAQYLVDDFQFRFTGMANKSNEDANVDNVQLLATSLAQPANAAPIAMNDGVDLLEEDNTLVVNAAAGVLANDGDADGDPMTAVLLSSPANGSITLNTDGSFMYTPNPNFNGNDSFTYAANDGTENGNTATVSITINQVDDVGVFGGDLLLTTNEDTTANGLITFSDMADGDSSPSFIVNSTAANGVASIDSSGNWSYTPALNFNGSDSFEVAAIDDDGNIETQIISLTITPVDDLTANDDAAVTNEDTLLNGNVGTNDSTTSGGSLSFAVDAEPSSGVLQTFNGADGSFTYIPNSDFNGSDSFTYIVTDSVTNETATRTVGITVDQVNDPGSFGGNLSATTDEDTATGGIATFVDPVDGFTTPNFNVSSAATNGVPSIDASGNWAYTPNTNFNGVDSFAVSTTDDGGNVETQTVTVTVTPIIDLTAIDDGFNINEDGAVIGNVSANDSTTSGGTLGFTVDSGPSSGSLSLGSDGSFTYTPTGDFHGSDSFTYMVNDASANEVDTRTVSITIDQVNDAGFFGGDLTAIIDENATASGLATFADTADGFGSANFILASPASNGVASIDNLGNWSYTPAVAFFGADNFSVSVTDDDGNVETQLIGIAVNEVTDLTANDDSYNVNEDSALNGDVSSNDSTTSGGTLSFVLNSGPSNGLLGAFNSDGSFTYTPDTDFNGLPTITVRGTAKRDPISSPTPRRSWWGR